MDVDLLVRRAHAFNHLFDAVIITDAAGFIIDWNDGAQDLYGYAKKDIIEKPIAQLLLQEDSTTMTELVNNALEQHGKWSGELRFLHQDGSIGWQASTCVPLFDDNQMFIGALIVNRDITQRVNQSQLQLNQACYDQLTSLPNRYLLMDRVQQSIERCKRTRTRFSLLYIDLDEFKKVNDAVGHLQADKVLVEITSRLQRVIRESDTLARIGADEFLLLLEDVTDNNDISQMAEVLIATLDTPFILNDQSLFLNCSVGIATYPDSGEDFDKLIKAADFAMYKSKRQGGATYRFG